MNKIILTTVAALLTTVTLPTIAQDVSVDAGVAGGVSVDTPSTGVDVNASGAADVNAKGGDTSAAAGGNAGVSADANTNADANANADAGANANADNTYGSVVAAVNASASVDLTAITDEADVTIVLLSSLAGEAATEGAGLDAAIAANAEAQAKVQDDAWANAAIKAKLEADGYTSEDIVAVKTVADGSVIVYVDDVE